MDRLLDTLVIGAGQAGLAAGYHLQRARRSFAILEAGSAAGGAWPHYYDSLRLFSPAQFSSLPGLPFPGLRDHYPTRDAVVAYLRQYAAHFQLPISINTQVRKVTCTGDVFMAHAADGRTFAARSVIAATGAFYRPYQPVLPGQAAFGGRVLHSAAYRQPLDFAGQRVVVVGGGNSAVQIAVELARSAHVTLATRHPLRFVSQRPAGRDIHFWWWLVNFDQRPLTSPLGRVVAPLAAGPGPHILDAGSYQAALATGQPDRQPMFSHFTPQGVVWADGHAEHVDTVIFATGYRPNVDYLTPLGALDAHGQPYQQHGISTTTAGLAFVGLNNQRTLASATLRGVGADAALVVRHLTRAHDGRRSVWQSVARVGWRPWRCCALR